MSWPGSVTVFSIQLILSLRITVSFSKHWPARFCDDHLRAELVELVPQVFGLQSAGDVPQLLRITPFLEHRVHRRWDSLGRRRPRRRAGRRRRYDHLVGTRRRRRGRRVAAQPPFSLRFSVWDRVSEYNKNKNNKIKWWAHVLRSIRKQYINNKQTKNKKTPEKIKNLNSIPKTGFGCTR